MEHIDKVDTLSAADKHNSLLEGDYGFDKNKTATSMLIEMLPKPFEEILEISRSDEKVFKAFKEMVKQSFRYMLTIHELQEEIKNSQVGSEEFQRKDASRTRTHNSTIDSINIWSRSLRYADIDNGFLQNVVQNRVSYGNFAMGIAAAVYLDKKLFNELTQ